MKSAKHCFEVADDVGRGLKRFFKSMKRKGGWSYCTSLHFIYNGYKKFYRLDKFLVACAVGESDGGQNCSRLDAWDGQWQKERR